MTFVPSCPHCSAPTRPHCKTGACTWRVCINKRCLAYGDPTRNRWTAPNARNEPD